MQYLAPWSTFYTMTGEASAALTGLMFVVITMVNQRGGARTQDGIATFSTPTVLHFSSALFASAILIAPLRSLLEVATPLALAGLYGVVHVLRVIFRSGRLRAYEPDDFEDWALYAISPIAAYATISAGALALPKAPADALVVLGAGVLLLIFVGIRNAWDTVTFIVAGGADDPTKRASEGDDA